MAPQERLVAYQGKLITVQDVMGVVANGTGAPYAELQPGSLRALVSNSQA